MTTNLLVLQYVDEGKLTVNDAVQLLETLAEEESPVQEFPMWEEPWSPITFFIIQGNG